MNYYADSSFLVSCYVTDANTPQAKGYLLRTGTPLVFTALHALEVRNAFKLGTQRDTPFQEWGGGPGRPS